MLSLLVSSVAATGWPSPAAAQGDRSPIPEFTGARVYTSGVTDEFGPLRDDIARIEKSSPQTYYVVVVRSTGPGNHSIRAYLEQMIDRWESQARRAKLPFDEKRAVVILSGIENRKIIVLGGEELQEQYGFRDPYIERDLIQPHFFPYAKQKDYLRGLRMLVAQIDRWIVDRDATMRRRREEAAAREARLKVDARAALDGARRRLEETRKEIEARKAAGFGLGTVEARARQASDDLDAAARRLDTSGGEAIDLAQQAQRELQHVVDQLRRISARQAEVDEKSRHASALAADVLKAIEAAGREGLPVAPAQAALDAANAGIEQAHQAVKADPDKAELLIEEATRTLTDARELVKRLPELRSQVKEVSPAIDALANSAKAELDRAQQAGVATKSLWNDWERASGALAIAGTSAGTDDSRALESYEEARTTLIRVRDQARTSVRRHLASVRRHRFFTLTLPLMLLALFTAIALGILGLFWHRKRKIRGIVDEQFKGFREQSVALMDRLDALRHRHKTLTATDPDFTHPTAGATLALHKEVEDDLNSLWSRWLGVMEVWDKAQKLVGAGSGLAVAQTEEAKALLEKEGNFDELTRQCASCEERLDRLNRAHEAAREGVTTARDDLAGLLKTIDEVAAAGFPADPYRKETRNVEGLLAQAEGLIAPDPIGASEVVAHSREALAAVADRSGRVLARYADARAVLEAIEEVAARASALRAEGLKLTEDRANPDPKLDQARRQQAGALDALQEADPASAGNRIDQARASIDQARQGIDAHIEARDDIKEELPIRLEASRRLRLEVDKAAALVEELGRDHAAGSWSDVAGNLDEARTLLRSVEEHRSRAERDASDGSQDYLRASSSLAQAGRDQAEAEELLLAIGARHRALADLARQSRERMDGLDAEVREVGSFFEENRDAIGPEARRSYEQAEAAFRELAGLMRQTPSDWPEISKRIEAVRNGCEVSRKQGAEDVDQFLDFSLQLEQAKRKAERIGDLLKRQSKDRPPANQRHRAAVESLAQVERAVGSAAGDWDRLLGRLEEVSGNLDRAEALAGEDISLANRAVAEIAEADRTIREARAFYASGVTVDVSEAASHLSRARGALATQAYEQAIELANAAEKAARGAYQAAAHEARVRRMRSERGGVYVSPVVGSDLIIAAAAAAASRWLTSSSGTGFTFPQSMPTQDSNSPSGSWGGGTSQGKWTEGADQAGW